MTSDMTWHADASTLQRYQAHLLSPASTASIEAHLMSCASCRTELATLAEPGRHARNWGAISQHIDRPSLTLIERVLGRTGIGEHRARLVVSTPALRLQWIVAICAVLTMVVLVHEAGGGSRGSFFVFLVLAPVLPLAGVAAAFNGRGDPARELISATPHSAFELVLVRTLAVVGVTSVLTTVAALAFSVEWVAATWLLPALALSAATLALATWIPAEWAAGGLASAWFGGAAATWRLHRLEPDIVERFFAFRPSGQLLFAAVLVVGSAVVVMRREAFDLREVYA